jgi:hypothetical protein
MHARYYSYLVSGVILGLLLLEGCQAWEWTVFEYFNRSNQKLYVRILGVSPDPSPGVLVPNDDNETTPAAASHFGDSVVFNDVITIEWSTKGGLTKKEVKFKRSDLGIPAKVSGGKITAVYTLAGDWEVKYSR